MYVADARKTVFVFSPGFNYICKMNDINNRIARLLSEEDLTASRLAEVLGVQASSISHLLSGRNKPSYDFIAELMRHYPSINPDWLILGVGDMYKEGQGSPQSSLFPLGVTAAIIDGKEPIDNEQAASDSLAPQLAVAHHDVPDVGIEQVMVFYSDHTVRSYKAKK